MNSNWNAFLAKQGAQDNFEHFGDPPGELAASRSGTIVVPLADQGVIRATGEDAAGFLHNLLTNDITHIPADGARHAGMCTAKGRLIASFLIWREGADYGAKARTTCCSFPPTSCRPSTRSCRCTCCAARSSWPTPALIGC